MAEKEDEATVTKDFDERLTWKKGDLQIIGPDGKAIDPATLREEDKDAELTAFPLSLADQEEEPEADGPTVHLYLDPGDVE